MIKIQTIWSLNITKTTKTLFYPQWLHHNTSKNIVQCFPYLLLLSHCFWNNSCSIHLQSILPKAICLFDGLVATGGPLFCRVRTSNCLRLFRASFNTHLRFCGDRLLVCLSAFLEIGVLLSSFLCISQDLPALADVSSPIDSRLSESSWLCQGISTLFSSQ